MVMKQTQTKLFDFSDVGLDFCAGSKNLFPDRFKKMLAQGYNEQTVSSVAVAGNQVTLSYGVSHGYVADRVLKVNAPELLSINDGEFVIDSVTENTVTMTIDGAPALIAGNFTTKVASLGWELVYELNHIHIYKFKHIDDTNMYLRLCFQTVSTQRNCVVACVGKTFDVSNGLITDLNVFNDLATAQTVANITTPYRWEYAAQNANTANNYTYSQGYASYGKGVVVGSKYHFISMHSCGSSADKSITLGVIPFYTQYENINYPILLCQDGGAITGSGYYQSYIATTVGIAGKEYVRFTSRQNQILANSDTKANFMPDSIEPFLTTAARPIFAYTSTQGQMVGVIYGVFEAQYGNTADAPALGCVNTPRASRDIDLNNIVFTHPVVAYDNTGVRAYFAVPVEEVKIV